MQKQFEKKIQMLENTFLKNATKTVHYNLFVCIRVFIYSLIQTIEAYIVKRQTCNLVSLRQNVIGVKPQSLPLDIVSYEVEKSISQPKNEFNQENPLEREFSFLMNMFSDNSFKRRSAKKERVAFLQPFSADD